MSQGIHLRKYGVATTIPFELYEIDGVDLRVDAVSATGDVTLTRDEAVEEELDADAFVDEGRTYSLAVSATEMQAARIMINVVDQSTKVWLDKVIIIETYGNASAMHAMDFDDAVRGGMTALPNAAADAAGGVPISDAGGLDLDAKLAATNEVTAARMGALTDWIDGGRLDVLLDAIKAVTDVIGYEHNAIWIDTVNGAAGTTDYVNGTVDNPVNSIADANTLAASLSISRFEVAINSSLTFVAAQANQVFNGDKWTLALGGQNVAGSVFIGAAVSGVMAGTGVLQKFINCVMNATSLIKGTVLIDCLLAATQTVVEAGEFLFDSCSSSIAGTGSVTFDFGAALNSSNLSVRHHSGGWTIENMGAGTGTYNATFEGNGQIVWAASCSATSNASIRGNWRITDNASGAVTETLDDNQAGVDAILVDTSTTLPALLPAALVGGRIDATVDATGFEQGAIDNIWDEIITGAAHNTNNSAGKRLRQASELGTYSNGAIYIDTVNGAAGTTDFENGTDANPVLSIADADTLAASLGISRFVIASGSSLTFIAAQTNQAFIGENWTLALGGQDIDGSTFIGATVTGIGVNTAGVQQFIDCMLGAVTLPGDTHCIGCGISGTQTMGEAGEFFYDNCHSAIAGTGKPTIDFGAGNAASNLHVRHHSGGWGVANMGAGAGAYDATFEGHGQIEWLASCSATSNASVRGMWRITDSAGGAVTVTLDDNTANVVLILADTNELQTDDVPSLIAALNDPTVAAIADAVLDELLAGHTDADSLGKTISDILTDTNELQSDDVPTLIAALNDIAASDVLTQVNAALDTAIAELAVAAPTATPTLRTGLMLLYMMTLNKFVSQTSGTDAVEVHNAAGTKIASKAITDDGSDYTEAKMISG